MVTNGLQRNVHSAGFLVYLVETTDMQQLHAFMLYSSLVPRLFGGGGKRAWYILRAHARNRPDIPRPPDSICTRP